MASFKETHYELADDALLATGKDGEMTERLPRHCVKDIDARLERIALAGHRVLLESEVYGILRSMGISTPPHATAASPEAITPELLAGFPSQRIVIKAASRDLPHKQKHQGVDIVHKDLEFVRYRENVAARLVNLVHRHRKPTVVSICVASGADAVYNKFGQVLDAGGVPTFLTANRAMICLNAFIRYRLTRETGNLSEWLK